MNVVEPEIKLAQRVVSRFKLSPPVDIYNLTLRYATIQEVPIPFEIDGVCQNIKRAGKTPHIILNSIRGRQRIRFTLAHELGHILIPWHFGSFVDVTDVDVTTGQDEYWIAEAEANRFASELLIPSGWISTLLNDINKPSDLVWHVSETADVSVSAATVKVIQNLPPGYIYALLSPDDEVLRAQRSPGTIASPPHRGQRISPEDLYSGCSQYGTMETGRSFYAWWQFDQVASLPNETTAFEWREVLDTIVVDLGIAEEDRRSFKSSVNGIVAYANGMVRKPDRSAEAIYSAALQRFQSKPELKRFSNHPMFAEFLVKRVRQLSGET